MKNKILIVEDDAEILKVLKLYLASTGYEIYTAGNGLEALDICRKTDIDLGIFDLMIPGISGYELTREVRMFSEMPILILSAMAEDHDKILGFNVGADDYITKPFNIVELIARVRVSLKRWNQIKSKDDNLQILTVGEVTLDLRHRVLFKNDIEIQLTSTEFKILNMMMRQPESIFSKAEICKIVYGEYFESDENVIVVHISHIREKIGHTKGGESHIRTKRGLGYKFEG